jgi:hypothetical protein
MCWIEPGFRIVNLEVDILAEMRNARVVDLVMDNGCCNWERLSWIPCNILNKLIVLPTPEDINDDDSNY